MEIVLNPKPSIIPKVGDIIIFDNDPKEAYLLIYNRDDGWFNLLNLRTSEYDFYAGEIDELMENIGGFYTIHGSDTFRIVSK